MPLSRLNTFLQLAALAVLIVLSIAGFLYNREAAAIHSDHAAWGAQREAIEAIQKVGLKRLESSESGGEEMALAPLDSAMKDKGEALALVVKQSAGTPGKEAVFRYEAFVNSWLDRAETGPAPERKAARIAARAALEISPSAIQP